MQSAAERYSWGAVVDGITSLVAATGACASARRRRHEGAVRQREAGRAQRSFVALTLLFLATAGGRITASDEYTMYRLTESLVTKGAVSVDAGNAERGPDGRLYPKAALGQALAAAPFYALGRARRAAVRAREARARDARRHVAPQCVRRRRCSARSSSCSSSQVGASPRGALFWTLATCLTTPLWVYAKSFLTEPLLALGLVAGLYGALRFRARAARRAMRSSRGSAGAAQCSSSTRSCRPCVVLALPFVPSLQPRQGRAPGDARRRSLCLALALLYNLARTGSPLGTGYGRQATAAAFPTPLFVGLYGLLLSSGKGVLWFAPLVALVPAGDRRPRRGGSAPSRGRSWPRSA